MLIHIFFYLVSHLAVFSRSSRFYRARPHVHLLSAIPAIITAIINIAFIIFHNVS